MPLFVLVATFILPEQSLTKTSEMKKILLPCWLLPAWHCLLRALHPALKTVPKALTAAVQPVWQPL